MQIETKMMHGWNINDLYSQNHYDPNVKGLINFLPILYFVIDDDDYIEITKVLKTPNGSTNYLFILWVL
jgi:hypothetical protein